LANRASDETLGNIHDSLATWCTLVLQGVPLLNDEGKAVLKPDGQPWLIPPSPAHLNVIRQFLKDNSVDTEVKKGNPLGILKEASDLPFGNNVTTFPKKSTQ
jgi:hypothetical protein